MEKYLIDGNNLIGKSKKLSQIQIKDKQAARTTLIPLIDRFLKTKKISATVFFDGFSNEAIPFGKGKIVYSEKATADDKIKSVIENNNINARKRMVVVSSDNGIINFAKVCGCKVLSSEEFLKELNKQKSVDEEKLKIEEMNNVEEFKKLFGVKNKK